MSLDIELRATRYVSVFDVNITHNLGQMASEAGIYELLWRSEEVGIKKAKDLIIPLGEAIKKMVIEPERFKKFNPKNGWGSYDIFLRQLKDLYQGCEENPDADIETSR